MGSSSVRGLFEAAPREQARVLVLHHNVLRGDISKRMGLARWRQAQRRIVASGAEVVLCGHDHQEGAELLGGRVVVSTAGTLCKRTRGGRPSTFNFVTIEPTAVHITYFKWDAESRRFRASDTYAFARAGKGAAPGAAPAPAPPPPQPAPADTTTHSSGSHCTQVSGRRFLPRRQVPHRGKAGLARYGARCGGPPPDPD